MTSIIPRARQHQNRSDQRYHHQYSSRSQLFEEGRKIMDQKKDHNDPHQKLKRSRQSGIPNFLKHLISLNCPFLFFDFLGIIQTDSCTDQEQKHQKDQKSIRRSSWLKRKLPVEISSDS